MKEIKYYGLAACLAIWEKRGKDIIRLYLEERLVKKLRPLLKWCAEHKKAYHIVGEGDLEKLSSSTHHEGIVLLAKEKPLTTQKEFFEILGKLGPKVNLLYLDRVENPHNIGSILRSCAHFGVPFVLGEEGKLPPLSPSACRVAKGGAERVSLLTIKDPIQLLTLLKNKGFTLLATSSHEGHSIYSINVPEKCIWIMGSESYGVSKGLLNLASTKVEIPGKGEVESLNVSVAAALCLGEYFRAHGR